MDTTSNLNNINNIFHSPISYTVNIWVFLVIGILTLAVILLTWLLFKKEKALQLMTFSISPIGLKLTYELNKDEKVKHLILDNIALQNELKIVKTTLKNERWRSFGLLIVFFFTIIVFYIWDKLKLTKTNKTNNVESNEEMKTSSNF